MEHESTKKEQILTLFTKNHLGLEEIEQKVGASTSYIAKVLKDEGHLPHYFDLYTPSKHAMNIYAKIFVNRLGFKTVKIAQRSVSFINRWYQKFKISRDHAGQHHAMVTAMTMFNRARWTKKKQEAAIFQEWIIRCLQNELHELEQSEKN